MRHRQTSDITELTIEMVKIKKIVHELYDRLMIPESIVETVMPTAHVSNIWAIPEQKKEETKEEKR